MPKRMLRFAQYLSHTPGGIDALTAQEYLHRLFVYQESKEALPIPRSNAYHQYSFVIKPFNAKKGALSEKETTDLKNFLTSRHVECIISDGIYATLFTVTGHLNPSKPMNRLDAQCLVMIYSQKAENLSIREAEILCHKLLAKSQTVNDIHGGLFLKCENAINPIEAQSLIQFFNTHKENACRMPDSTNLHAAKSLYFPNLKNKDTLIDWLENLFQKLNGEERPHKRAKHNHA